jgi:hypothetical protein
VLVGTRHAEWQAVRDQFRRASSVDDLPEAVQGHVGHPTSPASYRSRRLKLTTTGRPYIPTA